MEIPHPYNITGARCGRCKSEGPFLLDPDDTFAVREDGTIDFPEGDWGLDLGCKCPRCGFAGELGDFSEWVEVVGEEREELVKDFRERFQTPPASSGKSRRGVVEDALDKAAGLDQSETTEDPTEEA
jgi:hypothetical protein